MEQRIAQRALLDCVFGHNRRPHKHHGLKPSLGSELRADNAERAIW